ncbi:MAG: Hint domain-containing protein [Acetobacteraceae bacterium]
MATPTAGDTAIITVGTVLIPLDATLVGNTVELGGTGGTVAGLQFQGDAAISLSNPSLDGNTLVESLVQGQSTAAQSLLDTLGTFVNQGTIEANGTTGSVFTIDVQQGTAGNAGAFINTGNMNVSTGDTMVIAVGTNAAFYNASNINVQGGSLLLTTLGAGAIDGGLAPIDGVVVMTGSATVEDNIAYGPSVSGPPPVFAFADSTDTLKLDQQAQFGGVILNFTAGDTIDLGPGLTGSISNYNTATGVLTLTENGTVVSSLIMAGGAYSSASFQTTAAASGDLLLTTTGTDVSWITNGGGSFGAGTNWSGGSPPGPSSAVVIGLPNNKFTGVITTSGSQSVRSLLIVGHSETLAVGGSLGTGALVQGGGTIEVTGGATLGAVFLQQIGGGAVQLDSGSQLTLTGATNLGFANAGTLTGSNAGAPALLLQGSGFINGGTLTAGGFTDIGEEGGGSTSAAQVTVSAGGVVTDTYALLNSGPTSFGSLTLTGSGTSWSDAGSATDPNNPSGFMEIGVSPISGRLPPAGPAGLTVTQGATLTEQGSGRGGFARIGYQTDTSGIVNVTSGGVWNIGLATGGFLQVGAFGSGTLNIAGGTVAVGGNGTYVANGSTFTGGGIGIGRFAGGTGVATVDGGVLSSADGISVGNQGTGSLAVLNGGTVITTANGIGVGNFAGAVGTATVSGIGSDIIISGTTSSANGIGVGKAGFGAMTITAGGSVLLTDTGGGVGVGQSAGGFGSLVIGGGNALLSLGTATRGLGVGTNGGSGAIEVQSGGTVMVDSTNYGIGLGETTGATGTLMVSGAGALVTLGTATTGIGVGGSGGTGLLEVLSGATVSLGSKGVGLASTSTSSGTVIVGGTGALLSIGSLAATGLNIGTGTGLIEILAGGTIFNAGTGSGSGISYGSTGTLEGDGLVNSSVNNGGTILAVAGIGLPPASALLGGTLEIADSVIGAGAIDVGGNAVLRLDAGLGASGGTVAIGAAGTLALGGTISGSDTIAFAGSGAAGVIVLDQPGATLTNAVQNLSGGDIIALRNFTTISGASVDGSTITVSGTVGVSQAIYQLTDVGFATGSSQNLLVTSVIDPSTGGTVQAIEVACFAAGTRLAAASGTITVERLRAGDVLRTAGGALRPVRWVGHRSIDLTRHPDPRRAQPIRVCADAFADGVPSRDLLLSPDHAVFDRGRLIPIRLLVNGATITRETRRRKITYYHVELDSHDLLLAEGLPAESFLDCGNRGIFENAAEPLILHPDFYDPAAQAARRLAASCAPLTDSAELVAPVWWRLADRAVALGGRMPEPAFTADPALSVRADGRTFLPVAREGSVYRFALPAGPTTLVSRSAYPQDATPWIEDQRRLGVMVRGLRLDETEVPLEHPALAAGWWGPETDGAARWRWTDGAAALGTLTRPAVLTVTLGDTLPYPRRRPAA